MKKRYLYAPGPTTIPERVLAATARPLVHHRFEDFARVYETVVNGLKMVMQTRNDVIMLTGSGTAAMEATVANLLSPGDRALVVRAGHFGERWSNICRAYGVSVKPIDVEWGRAVNPKLVEQRLKEAEGSEIKAVFTTLVETSTGVINDTEGIGEVVRDSNAVLVVDTVAGLGGENFLADDWSVDVTVGACQKCLMTPPGLSFVSLSEKAWKLVPNSKSPRYYFDFVTAREKGAANGTLFTPAIGLFFGLAEALKMIEEEGLENVYRRHELLARACRAAVQAMGLQIFPLNPANVLSTISVPDKIDGVELSKHLRDHYGITFGGGQGQLKGRVLRVGHMGYFDRFDLITSIAALEMALRDKGFILDLSVGVRAAQEILMSE
jgi:aspartate aminotransferase-like enzyme